MTSTSHIEFEVRSVDDSDLVQKALAYLIGIYNEEFSLTVGPPEYLAIAHIADKIVGTLGVNTAEENSNLRLCQLYSYPETEVTSRAAPELSVEFCRWTSSSAETSFGLIYSLVCFSLSIGKKYVWCEHSRAVNRTARRLGIEFSEVKDAKLNWELIEKEYLNYYKKVNPVLFIFDLVQAKAGLEQYANKQD